MALAPKSSRFKRLSTKKCRDANYYQNTNTNHDVSYERPGDYMTKSRKNKAQRILEIPPSLCSRGSTSTCKTCFDCYDDTSSSSICSCKTSYMTSGDTHTSTCSSLTRLKICAQRSMKRKSRLENNLVNESVIAGSSDFSSGSLPIRSLPSLSDDLPSVTWSNTALEKISDVTIVEDKWMPKSRQEEKVETPVKCKQEENSFNTCKQSQETSRVSLIHSSSSSPALMVSLSPCGGTSADYGLTGDSLEDDEGDMNAIARNVIGHDSENADDQKEPIAEVSSGTLSPMGVCTGEFTEAEQDRGVIWFVKENAEMEPSDQAKEDETDEGGVNDETYDSTTEDKTDNITCSESKNEVTTESVNQGLSESRKTIDSKSSVDVSENTFSGASMEPATMATTTGFIRPTVANAVSVVPCAAAANATADATSMAAATAQAMLNELISLRSALRLSPGESPKVEQPRAPSDVSATSTHSSSTRGRRFRVPFNRQRPRQRRRYQEEMDAQYTSYLVRLMEEQTMQGKPRGGMPNPRPVRLRLPQMERRPLPPLAVSIYCEAERLLVKREYEAALILFSRGAIMHPESPRFQAGILKARKAIEQTVDAASRLLLGDNKLNRGKGDKGRGRRERDLPQVPISDVHPAALAASAAAGSTMGMGKKFDRVVRLGELGRSVGRLRGGGDLGDEGEAENPLWTGGEPASGRAEPWYTVPLEGSGELLMGTIADIAKFVRRREEYWKRLPIPIHVPAVANLRDPKSAPLLMRRGTNASGTNGTPAAAPASGVANAGAAGGAATGAAANTASKVYAQSERIAGVKKRSHVAREAEGVQERSEKRSRTQLVQMEEAVRERRFADVLTIGGQLLRALEARRSVTAKQNDRDAMFVTAQNYIAIAHIERGELESAARVAERMVRRARGLPDQRLLASALATAGRLRAAAGQLGWAAACWEQMVPLVQDDETRAWLFHELGRCSFQLHELQTARKYGEWSLSAARRAGSARWALNAALLSAQTEMQDGHYAAAHTFLEEARPFCAQLQDAAAAAYIRDAERLILTDRLPTVVVSSKSKRENATPSPTPTGKNNRTIRAPELGGAGEGAGKPTLNLGPRVAAAAAAAAAATAALRTPRRGLVTGTSQRLRSASGAP